MSMSADVSDRLRQIEQSGWPIAYDGCHKIYYLEDEAREREARSFGYDIYPSTEVRALFERSCFLRFVSRWGFDNDDFAHPLNIEQGES